MKRFRLALAVLLLAVVTFACPAVVYADDPPDLEVDIGIVSGGDVDVDLGIEAGGDVSIDIGTGNPGNVNISGNPVNNLATKDDLAAATQGTVQYEDFVCGGSRMAIKDIYRILEELFGRQYLIADGLSKDIVFTQETEQRLNRLMTYTYSQDTALENHESAIVYLYTEMNGLIDVANHQVTALNQQTSQLEQQVSQLEQAQMAMQQDYNLKLMIASFVAIALSIALIILLARTRRRV